MTARFRRFSVALGMVLLAGCGDQARNSSESGSTAQPAPAVVRLDAGTVLKHKMECRTLGVQAEKEQFPDGKNPVESLNQGLFYFDSVFGYDEKLNTCVMLSGFQAVNLKTRTINMFQATLSDLLSNKVLETYFVLGDHLAPVSASRSAFFGRAVELVGDPLPAWLEQAPIR